MLILHTDYEYLLTTKMLRVRFWLYCIEIKWESTEDGLLPPMPRQSLSSLAAPPEKCCRTAILKKGEMESQAYTSCRREGHIYHSSPKESLKSVGSYTKSNSWPSKTLLTAFSMTASLDENTIKLICFDQLFQTTCLRFVPKDKTLASLDSIVLPLPSRTPRFHYRFL